jgi:uncharacterized membrane protein
MPGQTTTGSIVSFLKTENGQRLSIISFSLVATLVLVLLPGTAAAYVFGLPYLFFIPGFAVVRLFFWKGTSEEAKFVLSLGLSILVLIFLGLFLVLTPIGLTADTTRASLIVFALGAVAFDFLWKRPEVKEKGKAKKKAEDALPKTVKLDKVVAAMLGTALVVSAISLGLIVTAKYPSRTYFALTDENGSADINTTRTINSTLSLVVHMHNGESKQCAFRLVVVNQTFFPTQNYSRLLDKGEDWNQSVNISLVYYGDFTVNFNLYIQPDGGAEYFYGNLHIWVSVS